MKEREQGKAKQAFRVWAGLPSLKGEGEGRRVVTKRLRQWCSSEEVSARPRGSRLPIAESWADPEMMVSICSAAVGWDYLAGSDWCAAGTAPACHLGGCPPCDVVSVAAVVPLHGGHKDLGLGGPRSYAVSSPLTLWMEREHRAPIGLSMPILSIAHIPFAHIPLPKTQWSHLVARRLGSGLLLCVQGGQNPALLLTKLCKALDKLLASLTLSFFIY